MNYNSGRYKDNCIGKKIKLQHWKKKINITDTEPAILKEIACMPVNIDKLCKPSLKSEQ